MTKLEAIKKLLLEDPVLALKRRNRSFYERYCADDDQFGFSLTTFARWEPFFRFLFEDYFKVEVRGIENIPAEGRAILVGNHSGLLPLDGAMIAMAMANGHKSPRRVRYLVTDWFFSLPGIADWVKETGSVRATIDNAKALLEKDELVGIYPEGVRGVGKPFRERYRVLDFHPGFVALAIATQTPLIPVATVGGDEIYPEFTNLNKLARFIGMPFYPVTLTFPWLAFPLHLIPLPVRWMIHVHPPIRLNYPPERATDRKLVLRLAREIQYTIQRDLNRLLAERKSFLTGWDEPAPTPSTPKNNSSSNQEENQEKAQ